MSEEEEAEILSEFAPWDGETDDESENDISINAEWQHFTGEDEENANSNTQIGTYTTQHNMYIE